MIHNLLHQRKVVLASSSPRRKEIFQMIGVPIVIFPADIEEEIFTDNPRILVQKHASDKAKSVCRQLDSDCVIIGADTVVYHDKKILGKPSSTQEVYEMMKLLSNTSHYVYTGFSICYRHQISTAYEKTKVEFNQMSNQDIEEYLQTKEPFDKAGSYGIQGYGSQFIKKITGCYFNVMGFPVQHFYRKLKSILEKS